MSYTRKINKNYYLNSNDFRKIEVCRNGNEIEIDTGVDTNT